MKRKYNEINACYIEAAASHKSITESGEDPDNFLRKTNQLMERIKTELTALKFAMNGLETHLSKLFDFYQVEAKSDLRNGSHEFLTFFKKFCKEIEDSCPKE